jgi:hypothetical protein
VTREMALTGGSASPRKKIAFLDRKVLYRPIGSANLRGSGGERRLSQKPACATAFRHFEL